MIARARARAPRTLQRAAGGIGRFTLLCEAPHRHQPLELGMEIVE